MTKPRVALHWQIFIGLTLGLVVGVGVNLAWSNYFWGRVGVGDPTAYVRSSEPEIRGGVPSDVKRAARQMRVSLEAWTIGSTDTPDAPLPAAHNPYTRAAQARLLSPFLEYGEPTALPDDVMRRRTVPWLDRELRAFLDADEEQHKPLGVPEDKALGEAIAWFVRDVTLTGEEVKSLNDEAGLAASAALTVRKLNGFVGDLFLRLLRFIAAPIVLFSLIVGAASLNDLKKLSRIGGKTIGIYLCTTAVAITVGLLIANAVRPGSARFVPESVRDQLATDRASEAAGSIGSAVRPDVWDTMLNIVPTNPFEALAEGRMLQIVFAALAVGIALTLVPKAKGAPVLAFCDGMTDVIIKIVHVVMLTAPYAVFCLIAGVVADMGLGVLRALAVYALVVIAGLAAMMFVVYPAVLKVFTPEGYGRFFRAIAPAQLLAFSSSSSSATLPVTMDCVENRLGASEDVTSFAIPLGATINMDGTALYQGVAAVFIAQLYGLDLTLGQQLTIVLTATLASIGTAGVPGVGMIMLVIVLQSIGMSPEVMAGGIAIIFGVDRLLDMCRTTCNVTGDCMVAAVVASTEKELLTAEQVAGRAAGEAGGLDEFRKEDEERERALG